MPIIKDSQGYANVELLMNEYEDLNGSLLISSSNPNESSVEAIKKLINGDTSVCSTGVVQNELNLSSQYYGVDVPNEIYPITICQESNPDDPDATEIIPGEVWFKIFYSFN